MNYATWTKQTSEAISNVGNRQVHGDEKRITGQINSGCSAVQCTQMYNGVCDSTRWFANFSLRYL